MIANYYNMVDCFNLCNMEYFDGKLLFPQFKIMHSYRKLGLFQFEWGSMFDKTLYDPTISMSVYYDFTEEQFKNVMCHEMIHYYLAYFGIDRRCKHGKEFTKMAEKLNKKYGLHIARLVNTSTLKRSKNAPWFSYWLLHNFGRI